MTEPRTQKPPFPFIDLFAGIGGIRIALESAGGKCVFSSESDRFCRETYQANFGEMPYGDITKIDPVSIPDHDVLAGGFPCQTFSISGVSCRNYLGREHGFRDKTKGTLFFNIAEILGVKKPKMFLLENVKNLRDHNNGNTFKVIMTTLDDLGYTVWNRILDSGHWVPQHRERIFLVGILRSHFGDFASFTVPKIPKAKPPVMSSILDGDADPKYTLTDRMWKCLQNHAERHKAQGHGFKYGLVTGDSVAKTLKHRYYKDGSEILVEQPGRNPRRLTPNECRKLMGFPETFKVPAVDSRAYKQFGNSVVVPVVSHLAKAIATYLSGDGRTEKF